MKRKLVTFIIILTITSSLNGAIYYVAQNGDDTNHGSITQPFLTIQKAADIMEPGDTCIVREGVYRETVIPSQSGSAGASLVFMAYPDEEVIVSGADIFEPIWSSHSGNIYKAETSLKFNQLFVDGKMMNEARWPNAVVDSLVFMPRAIADYGTNTTTLVDSKLPAGDWEGAGVHITSGSEWISFTRKVTNYQAGSRFDFDEAIIGNSSHHQPESGNDYYFYGNLTALDIPTEWYLDSLRSEVYLWTPDGSNPTNYLVEEKQRPFAFDFSNLSYIEVRGFNIFSAAIKATTSDYIIIDHCNFRYSHHATEADGYRSDNSGSNYSNGSYNEWTNCVVAYCAGEGIRIRGDNSKIKNCIIHDVNYLAGHYAAISMQGREHEIRNNTLYNSGRSLLMHYSTQASVIEFNHFYGAGYLTDDCGITYCWDNDGEGTIIAYNWLHDITGSRNRWTAGIYIDDYSKNHIIHHNVTWNTPFTGVYIKQTNEVYNNTILASSGGKSIETRGDVSGAVIFNNLCSGVMNLGTSTNAANGNYPIDDDFVPTEGSGAIDAGFELPPYTDGFVGSAPDVGAYEFGGELWVPGAKNLDDPTGIPVRSTRNMSFTLQQNYPNPFNPSTTIHYTIPNQMDVRLEIFNILGQKVHTLVNEKQEPGEYHIEWSGKNEAGIQVTSGIYLYRIAVNGERTQWQSSRKMIMLK